MCVRVCKNVCKLLVDVGFRRNYRFTDCVEIVRVKIVRAKTAISASRTYVMILAVCVDVTSSRCSDCQISRFTDLSDRILCLRI